MLSARRRRGDYVACHVSLDAAGRHAFVANGGGSIAVLPIGEDGSPRAGHVLRSARRPQSERRAAGRPPRPRGRDRPIGALALGGGLSASRSSTASRRSEGRARDSGCRSGHARSRLGVPRHFAFADGGRLVFVLAEMALTVTAFRVNPATGAATDVQTLSTLPEGISPTAKDSGTSSGSPVRAFLYTSNRGLTPSPCSRSTRPRAS